MSRQHNPHTEQTPQTLRHLDADLALAYALAGLDADAHAEAAAHVAGCTDCRAQVEQLQAEHRVVAKALHAYAARPRPTRASDWAVVGPRILDNAKVLGSPNWLGARPTAMGGGWMRLAAGGISGVALALILAAGLTAAAVGTLPPVRKAVERAVMQLKDWDPLGRSTIVATSTPRPRATFSVGHPVRLAPTATPTTNAPITAATSAAEGTDARSDDSKRGPRSRGEQVGPPIFGPPNSQATAPSGPTEPAASVTPSPMPSPTQIGGGRPGRPPRGGTPDPATPPGEGPRRPGDPRRPGPPPATPVPGQPTTVPPTRQPGDPPRGPRPGPGEPPHPPTGQAPPGEPSQAPPGPTQDPGGTPPAGPPRRGHPPGDETPEPRPPRHPQPGGPGNEPRPGRP